MTHPAIEMYNYHAWANQTMLGHLAELPVGIYEQEIQSVFPTIAKVMPHIYLTDSCWLEILCGNSMSDAMTAVNLRKDDTEKKSIQELRALFLQSAEGYRAFFEQHENKLDTTIVVDNPYAGIRETSYAEIVLQVVNHATYHRGNITAMLRQLGHPSTMTEYALYWYAK